MRSHEGEPIEDEVRLEASADVSKLISGNREALPLVRRSAKRADQQSLNVAPWSMVAPKCTE
jgi:hypothetical protein